MKTIATISIIILSITGLFAFEGQNPETSSPSKIYKNGASVELFLPWANNSTVKMEKVYSKDEYSLWKCESQNVTNYPGSKITGEVYNYFIYKNGKFHMTVTDMNKNNVFRFFSK